MADKCLIAARNWVTSTGVSFAGGSWVDTATVRLANLLNTRTASYARTTGVTEAATALTTLFGAERRVDHFFIGHTNASDAGQVRVLPGGVPLDLDLTAQTADTAPTGFTFTRSTEASYYDENGILQWAGVDEPRYDHDPLTGDPKGYLHETSTDCSPVDSEDLSAWTDDGATVSANADTAPDGATTADRITEKATTATHGRTRAVTWSALTRYRVSWHAKNATRSWQCLRLYDGSATKWAFFDAATGVFGHVSSGITTSVRQLPNGWWRPCAEFQASAGAGDGLIGLYCAAADGGDATPSYAGSTGNRIIAWGVMVEAGSAAAIPSSYARTTTSNVTRAADGGLILAGDGFSAIVPAGGPVTLGATFSVPYHTGGGPTGSVGVDNAGTSYVRVGHTGSNASVSAVAANGGSTQFSASAAGLTLETSYTVVAAIGANSGRAAISGSLSALDTALNLPTVTRLVIGGAYNTHISRVVLCAGRMSDAGLTAASTDLDDFADNVPVVADWQDIVPITHTPVGGHIAFGRPSAAGTMPSDERDLRGVSCLIVLDEPVDISGFTLQFRDTANTDGYFQFSMLWAGMSVRPSIPPIAGAFTIGTIEESRRRRSLGGTLHSRRLWARQRITAVLEYQPEAEALPIWSEMVRRLGGTGEFLFSQLAPDGIAAIDRPRTTILGVLEEPPVVEHQVHDMWRIALSIVEL